MNKDAVGFFLSRFNITFDEVGGLVAVAMAKGGDYGDLYFEYRTNNSINLEEQIIKSASKSISQGVGVRVNSGDKTGYAFTDEIGFDSVKRAALTAAYISQSRAEVGPVDLRHRTDKHNLYPTTEAISDVEASRKIKMLVEADAVARNFDKRIREVQSSFNDEYKIVMIADSEGRITGDIQPLARLNVTCIADEDGNLQLGRSGGGGRGDFDMFEKRVTPKYLAEE